MPRRVLVSLGQGQLGFRNADIPTRHDGAPLWFIKMDRNGDGDLSPREFIGSEETFRKLDADGDGLISVEEARQYEARLKKDRKP